MILFIQKVKEAATDPYSEKLQELVTICKAMGLFYNHRVRGCNSAEEKVERIQDYLEEVGMKGEHSVFCSVVPVHRSIVTQMMGKHNHICISTWENFTQFCFISCKLFCFSHRLLSNVLGWCFDHRGPNV